MCGAKVNDGSYFADPGDSFDAAKFAVQQRCIKRAITTDEFC